MLGTSTYSLDAKKVQDAVGILDSELESLNSCIRIQRNANSGWRIAIWYAAIFAAAIIVMLMNHGWVSSYVAWLCIAASLLICSLVTLPSTVRTFRAFFQLRRSQRDLGLDRFKWFVGWREAGARMLRIAPFYLGIFLISFQYDAGSWIGDARILAGAVCMGISLHLLTSRALRPFETRVKETEILRSALLRRQSLSTFSGENATISLPGVEYKEIARIERALISLDRRRAVKQISTNREASIWAVQRSTRAMAKISALESAVQLRVQTRVDELSMNPEPGDAVKDTGGVWCVPVPQTAWAIAYTLAGNPQRIMIHDLLERAESKPSNEVRSGA